MRLAVASAIAVALLLPAVSHAASIPPVAPVQDLVVIHDMRGVRADLAPGSPVVATVGPLRPVTGAPTTLPVLARRVDHGRSWLLVRMPGRATGMRTPPRTGWISASRTTPATTPWHLVVDVAGRRVSVVHRGRILHTYRAIVGRPGTPTPLGQYFVEETVIMPAGSPGAPFALATSARSAVLQEFNGGPGQIALHGIRNLEGRLGTAVSHGCVRLGDADISWLAARIGPGVPITIR